MWERGLKCPARLSSQNLLAVAPHVGAWIEIGMSKDIEDLEKSLPMWERGLK